MVTSNPRVTKLISVAVALGLTTAVLAGCGSPGGSESAAGQEVVIGMNQGLIPQFEDYIAAYNATEPAAKVSLKPVPDGQADYLQQLVTEGLSGKLPDILFNYDSLNQTLDSNELLFDLKPWLEEKKSGLDGEEFVPAFLDQYKAQGPDGPITGIPVSADSTMLFYNKSIFEKYGISELPTEDWTYADMYRVAEQITKASAGATWGLRSPGAAGGLLFIDYPLLKANGSTIYNPDSGEFEFADANGLKAWKTMLAPYVEGWGSPYPTSNQDTNYFSGGQVAMSVDTRPTISKYRETITDDWDVVNLPTVDGEPTVGGGSYALSISEKSKNKESAWEFMAWFYSKDGGMKEAEPNGVIPATTSGLDHGTWLQDAAAVPTNLIPATQYSVKNAALQPAIPSEAQTEVVPALEKAAQEVLMGGKSIEVAYTAAEDALNALLK